MLTYNQHSQAQFAAKYGRLVNNWIDCDSVQDAITQLEDYKLDADPKEVLESINYLAASIILRTGVEQDTRKFTAYLITLFENTIPARICRRCEKPLSKNDDMICGYHHLEG